MERVEIGMPQINNITFLKNGINASVILTLLNLTLLNLFELKNLNSYQ